MIVHFSAHILKWELVCKFAVRFHILLLFLASVHGFMHETNDFYSIITCSNTKYFVHAYTVDVVFTLSYGCIIYISCEVETLYSTWLILGWRPANKRRRYFVTTSLFGRGQAWNQPYNASHELHNVMVCYVLLRFGTDRLYPYLPVYFLPL